MNWKCFPEKIPPIMLSAKDTLCFLITPTLLACTSNLKQAQVTATPVPPIRLKFFCFMDEKAL